MYAAAFQADHEIARAVQNASNCSAVESGVACIRKFPCHVNTCATKLRKVQLWCTVFVQARAPGLVQVMQGTLYK